MILSPPTALIWFLPPPPSFALDPSWLRMAFFSLFSIVDFMICNSFHFPGCCVSVLFVKCWGFFCASLFSFFSRVSSVPSMIQPWHNHFPRGFCLSHNFFTFPYLQKERLYHLPLKVPYKFIFHVLQLGVGCRLKKYNLKSFSLERNTDFHPVPFAWISVS